MLGRKREGKLLEKRRKRNYAVRRVRPIAAKNYHNCWVGWLGNSAWSKDGKLDQCNDLADGVRFPPPPRRQRSIGEWQHGRSVWRRVGTSKMAHDGLKAPQASKMTVKCLKLVLIMLQETSRSPQDGPKWPSSSLKSPPRAPQEAKIMPLVAGSAQDTCDA
eukprot:9476062-Pyramimonas_sp.AAC.1